MAARVFPVDAVSGAPSYTGRALRQTIVSPFVAQASTSRPLGGQSGVRPGTPTTIATATSTTWTVTPFLGVIDGEAAAIAGVYAYAFDSNQTGSVTAAAGSARVDRLDVQVSDPAESDGTSVPSVAIVYTAGTPGSGAPAAPARSHSLALINVPASGGGSPTVTWNAAYYAAPGGFAPSLTQASLPTLGAGQFGVVVADPTGYKNSPYVGYSGGTTYLPGTFLGETSGSSTTSIPTIGSTWYGITDAGVTFTTPGPTRIRVVCRARLGAGSGGSLIRLAPTYVAGSSVTTTGSVLGTAYSQTYLAATGGPGQYATFAEQTFLIASAGTYTAFPGYNSPAGGGQVIDGYCAVFAAGAV